MQVHRIGITRVQMMAIPTPERRLLVLVAHALNEVNVFNRLAAMSTRHDRSHMWLTHFDAVQTFSLVRTLVGKTFEAWAAVTKCYYKSGLSKTYHSALDAGGKEAEQRLKEYFGATNLLNLIRNDFAFHFSSEHAATELPEDVGDHELVAYFHDSAANTLYLFAEIVMNVALFDRVAASDPEMAFTRIIDEASAAIRHLNDFGQALIVMVLERFVGTSALAESRVSEELDVQKYEDARIPALLSIPQPRHGE